MGEVGAPCAQRAQVGVGDLCALSEVEMGEVGAPCAQRAQPDLQPNGSPSAPVPTIATGAFHFWTVS